MTAVTRALGSDAIAATNAQHTQQIHLVNIQFPGEAVYLSEGPQVTFDGHVFLDGRVRVSDLAWGGDGSQTCTIEIMNEGGYAAALFFGNKIADAEITVWVMHRKPDNTFTDPTIYATGSVDSSEMGLDSLKLTLVASRYRVRFFPNTYIANVGLNFIPAEGTVVFWNSTTYVLERDYG